jgi:hypothetical protein
MLSFQVNPRLNRDALSQYRAFLVAHQKETVSKEALAAICQMIERETCKQTQYAQAPLSDPNSKAALEMYQVAQIMTGSFLGGVMLAQNIAKELDKTDDETLAYIASMLDWGFWLPLDQKVVVQILEDDLQMLMRVGDSESSWLSQLDKAFHYYKDATTYNDFFQKSLQILLNLVSASKHDYGNYALMQRIGMLYLYHPDFLDALKDVRTGRVLESTYGRFYNAVFSPDARKLALASSDRSVKIMSAPEVPLPQFIAFEHKLRCELESLHKNDIVYQPDSQAGERRRGERRKPSYWLGGLDLREGKDRRQSSTKL